MMLQCLTQFFEIESRKSNAKRYRKLKKHILIAEVGGHLPAGELNYPI